MLGVMGPSFAGELFPLDPPWLPYSFHFVFTSFVFPRIVPHPAISLLQMLIHPMNAFPWVVNGIVEANVSKGRLEKLLLPADMEGCSTSPGTGDSVAGAARWEK